MFSMSYALYTCRKTPWRARTRRDDNHGSSPIQCETIRKQNPKNSAGDDNALFSEQMIVGVMCNSITVISDLVKYNQINALVCNPVT